MCIYVYIYIGILLLRLGHNVQLPGQRSIHTSSAQHLRGSTRRQHESAQSYQAGGGVAGDARIITTRYSRAPPRPRLLERSIRIYIHVHIDSYIRIYVYT